jgi:hypothetical protein
MIKKFIQGFLFNRSASLIEASQNNRLGRNGFFVFFLLPD